MDDMVITRADHIGITKLQQYLSQQFKIKNLERLNYFLSLEVALDFFGYYLSQAKYAMDILSQVRVIDNKVITTPIETNAEFDDKNGIPLSNPTLYRQLVGSFVYLTVARPDIAYAVHIVRQFMNVL